MVITKRIEREFITFKPIEGVYVEQRKKLANPVKTERT